jgi:ketosteroid isomerase-like protein
MYERTKRTSLAALVMICVVTTTPLCAASKDVAVAMAIAELENKWAAAQRVGDASAVAPLLAESFVNTDVNGKISGKADLLSSLKGGKWEENGISDVKVTVYGNTAVATGAWAGKGTDGDGTRIDRNERWTDTWIKMPSGKWQCVASQQTLLRSL